jgi:hypothetical protein
MKSLPGTPKWSLSVTCLFLLSGLLSCAGPRTYTVTLRYQPQHDHLTRSEEVVGLMPFEDQRTEPQQLGRRIRADGAEEPLVLSAPSPANELTRILRRDLEARGLQVVDLTGWQGKPEGLADLPGDVQVAILGRIESLEVQAYSSLWKTVVHYQVRLTADIGFTEKKEVLTRSIELRPEETYYFEFPSIRVETRLNLALSEAVDRLLEGVFTNASQP